MKTGVHEEMVARVMWLGFERSLPISLTEYLTASRLADITCQALNNLPLFDSMPHPHSQRTLSDHHPGTSLTSGPMLRYE